MQFNRYIFAFGKLPLPQVKFTDRAEKPTRKTEIHKPDSVEPEVPASSTVREIQLPEGGNIHIRQDPQRFELRRSDGGVPGELQTTETAVTDSETNTLPQQKQSQLPVPPPHVGQLLPESPSQSEL